MATAKGMAASGEKFTEKANKFFRGVWAELKKVHWPNKSQITTYTMVVLVAVFLVALLIWVVDSGLTIILEKVL